MLENALLEGGNGEDDSESSDNDNSSDGEHNIEINIQYSDENRMHEDEDDEEDDDDEDDDEDDDDEDGQNNEDDDRIAGDDTSEGSFTARQQSHWDELVLGSHSHRGHRHRHAGHHLHSHPFEETSWLDVMSDVDSMEDDDEDDGGDMDGEDEDDDYDEGNNGVVVIETGAGSTHRINPNMDPDFVAERDQEESGLLEPASNRMRSINLSDQFFGRAGLLSAPKF